MIAIAAERERQPTNYFSQTFVLLGLKSLIVLFVLHYKILNKFTNTGAQSNKNVTKLIDYHCVRHLVYLLPNEPLNLKFW